MATTRFCGRVAAGVGAVLSWVGLLHADHVAWAAAPQVALGYAILGAVLVGIALLQGRSATQPASLEITEDLMPSPSETEGAKV